MRDLLVSQTKVPIPGSAAPMTVESVRERQTAIKAVMSEAYEKD